MTTDSFQQTESNLGKVVTHGRDPELTLQSGEHTLSLPEWAKDVFSGLRQVALQLDKANDCQHYSQAVEQEWAKVEDPDLTPSARILNHLLEKQQDNGQYGLELAREYKQRLLSQDYRQASEESFMQAAAQSWDAQRALEASQTESFDVFLQNYFKL